MRIAQFLPINLANLAGGTERVYFNLANLFAARGHDVACYYFGKNGAPFYPLDARVSLKNCKASPAARVRLPTAQLLSCLHLDPIRRRDLRHHSIVRELKRELANFQPDIVLSYWPYPFLEELNVPVLQMLHMQPECFKDMSEALRSSLGSYAAVQVLMPEFVARLKAMIGSGNIVYIPNIVPQFSEASDCSHKKIIFVGRVTEQKRPQLIPQAFALLKDKYPDWTVELWGSLTGEPKTVAQVQGEIKKYGLERQVSLCGTTSDIPEKLKNSSIILMPSSYEGFGLALTEGMSMGLPGVVCADCPAHNTLVRDGENGFLCAPTPEDIARRLDLLMADEALRKRLGTQAKRDMKKFNPESVCDQWEQLMRQAVENYSAK